MDTKDLTKLSQDLECAVCMEVFTDPRVLICQHVFCLGCLEKHAKDRGMITCPTCRKDTLINKDTGVSDLPKPVTINKVTDTLSSIQLAHDIKSSCKLTHEKMCCLCEDTKASVFCHECMEFLCKPCNDSHIKVEPFSDHQITALDELLYCEEHNNMCKRFCETCKKIVCIKCLLTTHESHKHAKADDVVKRKKKEIEMRKDVIGSEIVFMKSQLQSLEEVEKDTEKQFDDCLDAVVKWGFDMVKKAQERTNQIVSEIESDKKETLKKFQNLCRSLEETLEDLETEKACLEQTLSSKNSIVKSLLDSSNYKPEDLKSMDNFESSKPRIVVRDIRFTEAITYQCLDEYKAGRTTAMSKEDKRSDEDAVIKDVRFGEALAIKVEKTEKEETDQMEVQRNISTKDAKPQAAEKESREQIIGQWKVKNKIALEVHNIIDVVCAQDEQRIFMIVKNAAGKKELIVSNLSGKKLLSTNLNKDQVGCSIAFDNKKNILIMACRPNNFPVYSSEAKPIKIYKASNIKDNSRMVYSKSYDSLFVVDEKSEKVFQIRTDAFTVMSSFSVSCPEFIDFDEHSGMIAVSSWNTGCIRLYNSNGSLQDTLKHKHITHHADICFNSGMLFGCNRDVSECRVWAVPTKGNKFIASGLKPVITRSDLTNSPSFICTVSEKRLLVSTAPQHLVYIDQYNSN